MGRETRGEGERDSEEWEIDGEQESSQSKDKKRHWRRGGSEVVRERWRDSKRCLIKKRSFSCHHQESVCQPTASVSEKKGTETSSADSHTSNSIGTGGAGNKGWKEALKGRYHTQRDGCVAYDLEICKENHHFFWTTPQCDIHVLLRHLRNM